MKLQKWLDAEGLNRSQFARRFRPKPTSPQNVDRWCDGTATPRKWARDEIRRITRGKVTEFNNHKGE